MKIANVDESVYGFEQETCRVISSTGFVLLLLLIKKSLLRTVIQQLLDQ